jgi:hypothetical protein
MKWLLRTDGLYVWEIHWPEEYGLEPILSELASSHITYAVVLTVVGEKTYWTSDLSRACFLFHSDLFCQR